MKLGKPLKGNKQNIQIIILDGVFDEARESCTTRAWNSSMDGRREVYELDYSLII